MKRIAESRRIGTAGIDCKAHALTLAQSSRVWNDKGETDLKAKLTSHDMLCGCRELDCGYIPFNFCINHYCWRNTDLFEVNMTTCLITGRTVLNQHWLKASFFFLVCVVTGWTGQLKTENVQVPPSELVIGWLLSFMVLISTLLGSESPPHKRRSKNKTDAKENKNDSEFQRSVRGEETSSSCVPLGREGRLVEEALPW